jgi:hypothetical protein
MRWGLAPHGMTWHSMAWPSMALHDVTAVAHPFPSILTSNQRATILMRVSGAVRAQVMEMLRGES